MTKADIEQQYQALSSKVGDLYFKVTSLQDQLRQAETQMKTYHDQRDAIQAAYMKAQAASESAPENAVEAPRGDADAD